MDPCRRARTPRPGPPPGSGASSVPPRNHLMPWLALLSGPAGRIAGIAGAVFGALLLSLFLLRQHDGRVRAELLAAQRERQIAELQADHARAVVALEADAAAARETARRSETVKAA